MNKKKLVLTLALGMMLGGCGKKSVDSEKGDTANVQDINVTDTMLVIGVLNQGFSSWDSPAKFILMLNKQGDVYASRANLATNSDLGRDEMLSFIERGDTVYVKNGEIVKNLTMDRMANRWVNSR